MGKTKKPFSLYSFLLPRLRRLSIQWPARNEVFKRVRLELEDGFYKNGNPKVIVRYKCESCGQTKPADEIEIDHKTPISNFAAHGSWDSYLNALFCSSENLQALCVSCHDQKSAKEAGERAAKRKKPKKSIDK